MFRYPLDALRAVSPSTLLRTLRFSRGKVEPHSRNGADRAGIGLDNAHMAGRIYL